MPVDYPAFNNNANVKEDVDISLKPEEDESKDTKDSFNANYVGSNSFNNNANRVSRYRSRWERKFFLPRSKNWGIPYACCDLIY
ncbi:unnamed protein product [Thelazia callipaeda]|uniref:Uncharacterized protein n=1 Tax=Thelazia callipaeda TaxID=103827 RepID=A0A0N5CRY5_THECL|nr:unnamed protein product [Thelazia callipaeda]